MQKNQVFITATVVLMTLVVQSADAQWFRRSNLRNNRAVLAGLKKPVSEAAKSTVRVLLDDKPVALGCVVSEAGEVLTKASLVDGDGKLHIRLGEGGVIEAERIATDERYDVALIKAKTVARFVPMKFHKDDSPVGTIIGVPSESGDVLRAGIVSLETGQPRLRDSTRRVRMGVNVVPAEGGGLTINEVVRETPAYRAKIRKGDRLISVDGLKVNVLNDLLAVLSKHKYGDRVQFRLERGGESKQGSILFRSPYDRWGGGAFSQRRFTFPKVVFHDAAIEPDECGGPLVDLSGRVIGLNISRALRVASYAVPASEIERLVGFLRGTDTSVTDSGGEKSASPGNGASGAKTKKPKTTIDLNVSA